MNLKQCFQRVFGSVGSRFGRFSYGQILLTAMAVLAIAAFACWGWLIRDASRYDPNKLIENDDIETLEYCLWVKPWIKNQKHSLRRTLLHKAALTNNVRAVRILCEAGANVNAVDVNFQTPLMLTSDPQSARILLEQGADPNHQDKLGYTVLHLAADAVSSSKEIEALCAVYLQFGASLETTSFANETPLQHAVVAGDEKMIEWLIRAGADTEFCTTYLPLQYAVIYDQKAIIQLLMDLGADPNRTDRSGDTSLHTAAAEGNLQVCKLLLENGVKINIKNAAGKTPLDLAKENGHKEVTKLLSLASGQ